MDARHDLEQWAAYERGRDTFSFSVQEAEASRELGERQLAHGLELLRRARALADEQDVREQAA